MRRPGPTSCALGREAFSSHHPACLSCQKQQVPCPFGGSVPAPLPAVLAVAKASKVKVPNKTEAECGRRLVLEFPGCEIRYEPMSLVVELDGERFGYRPDWGVVFPDGRLLLVEVKNAAYQHASYGRAKLAFAAARVRWPMFSYRWVEKDGVSWSVRDF